MKRYFILLAWLLGILLPMAWFGRFSETYRQVFNTIFGPPWMHVVTHALLFAVLAYLLASIVSTMFGNLSTAQVMAVVLAAAMLVAVLQEFVQLWYKGRLFGYAEVFDLGVDMLGVCAGLVVFGWRQWRQLEHR